MPKSKLDPLQRQELECARAAYRDRQAAVRSWTGKFPQLAPSTADRGLSGYTLYLRYPYNRQLMTAIEAQLILQGWKCERRFGEAQLTQTYEDVFESWSLGPLKVVVTYADHLDGSTCHRRVLAEEIKTRQEKTYLFNFCPQEATP